MKFDLSRESERALREIIGTSKSGSEMRVAAEIELDRRKWWKEFWTKGIVAWIALGLSLISIAWQIVKELLK